MKLKFIIIIIIFFACLISCEEKIGSGPPDEEIFERLLEIVPLSQELNEIFVGEGIKPIDKAVLSEYNIGAQYFEVAYDAKYRNMASIKNAAESVYSKSYLNTVYQLAFEGIESEKITPRYKEVEGVLYVDIAHRSLDIRTVIDLTSAVIIKNTPSQVKIQVNYTLDGEENSDGKMTLTLINQNGVWLLDAPTF